MTYGAWLTARECLADLARDAGAHRFIQGIEESAACGASPHRIELNRHIGERNNPEVQAFLAELPKHGLSAVEISRSWDYGCLTYDIDWRS